MVVVGGPLALVFKAMLLGPLLSRIGGKQIMFMLSRASQPDLLYLRDLLAAGSIVPVIDRRYPLSEVAEAMRYLAEGHAQGKVIINVV